MAHKKPETRMLFVPLGGSGEIGMNMNLYAIGNKWIMVDCGMTFSDERHLGTDLIFPDPLFIAEMREKLIGIIITHGHEDHIGAIPHLWEQLRAPIYATEFTAMLIEGKLHEVGLHGVADVGIVKAGEENQFGPFKITYVPLAHSIAEGNGLIIRSEVGTVFHTGDWKLDDNPLIGPACPSDTLTKLGDEGVLALVGDSTNVFNKRASGSEKDVRDSLMEIVGGLSGRVAVTTFASNVARIKSVGEIAKAHDRDVVLLGRSMHRIYNVARAAGYLEDFPRVVDEDHADSIPKNKVLYLCTGCQGEDRAALSRIARGDHRNVSLSEGDTVIFSSKIIPGNEKSLGELFNALSIAKIDVITEKDKFTHVSGHPGQDELAEMYKWVRPEIAIPVHGEARHLKKHAEFAKSVGVPKALVPSNGDIIEITAEGARVIDQAPYGRLTADGKKIVPVESGAIGERRQMAWNGTISVAVVLDDDGALMAEPRVMHRGLPEDEDRLTDDFIDAVEDALENMKPRDRQDDNKVYDALRIKLRRYTRKHLGKNPPVDVMIIREDEF